MNECRDAIAALQAERDDISAKIYDPDQVREILEELTNQLDSLADKMKSADSWQKDQLVRKLVTNLEINNKNEVSFRWKKPLGNVFNQALKNRTRFGAPNPNIYEPLCKVIDYVIMNPAWRPTYVLIDRVIDFQSSDFNY